MSISNQPNNWQPREKLLKLGPNALSDLELLAIFLRTGTKSMPVLALAEYLITHFGSLNNVLTSDTDELTNVNGVGAAKSAQIKAVLELSRRCLCESLRRCGCLDSPRAVRDYLQLLLRDEPYEKFLVIYLDNQHCVIQDEVLFSGTIDCAAVYPRVVVDRVIQNRCAAVIFAHNHPSGIAEPSQADIQLTRRLQQALQLIDVRTLDHFVVGHGDIVSFAERGLL